MKNQLFLIAYIIPFSSDIYSFHKPGAETFAARDSDICHMPTLPRQGIGSGRRLTLERSHQNLIFAILRPLYSVKNHNRICVCACKGIVNHIIINSIIFNLVVFEKTFIKIFHFPFCPTPLRKHIQQC